MKTEAPAYKRIVLKLSGEALRESGERENISPHVVHEIAKRITEVHDLGVQVAVVIGSRRPTAEWTARPRITWACSRP